MAEGEIFRSDQHILDQSIIDQSMVDQSDIDQSVMDHSILEEPKEIDNSIFDGLFSNDPKMQNHDSSFTKESEDPEKPVSVPVPKKGKCQSLSARNSNLPETDSSPSKKRHRKRRKKSHPVMKQGTL